MLDDNPTYSPSSSLDCKRGLKCNDYECEFRHLDLIEQRQRRQFPNEHRADGSMTPSSTTVDSSSPYVDFTCNDGTQAQELSVPPPQQQHQQKLIVTASPDMGRTASTWVFNAVRLLHRQAHVVCDSYWIRTLSKEKLSSRMQDATILSSSGATARSSKQGHVLVKTHEDRTSQHYFQQEIVPMFTHVIVSVRDGFPTDPNWINVATYIVHYEDIVQQNPNSDVTIGALSVLRNLGGHLNIPSDILTDDELRQIDFDLMTLPIPGDQSTKFWSFHKRRGGRTIPLQSPKPKPTTVLLPSEQTETEQEEEEQEEPVVMSLRGGGPTAIHSTTNMNVYVTRHGARIDNGPDRDRKWLERAGHGRRHDAHMSPLGHTAASELATEFVKRQEQQQLSEPKILDYIVSSPFLRCMETAEAIAKSMNLKIMVEPGISEVGANSTQMASQIELKRKFASTIDHDYEPVMSRDELPGSNGGEWGDNAAARRACKVAQTIQRNLGGNILFVGHGASCLGLVNAFGGEGYVGYCSLTHFQWIPSSRSSSSASNSDEISGEWKLQGRFGDVTHLSDKQTALDSAW